MYLCVYVCMCTLSDMKDKFLFVMCTNHSSPLFTHILVHHLAIYQVHCALWGDCTLYLVGHYYYTVASDKRRRERGDGTHIPIIPMLVDMYIQVRSYYYSDKKKIIIRNS